MIMIEILALGRTIVLPPTSGQKRLPAPSVTGVDHGVLEVGCSSERDSAAL